MTALPASPPADAIQPGGGSADPAPSVSQLLRRYAGAQNAVPVGELLGAIGSRGHGLLLLIMALPELIPLAPSLSTVFGIPMVIVSAHLVLFGEGRGLPARIERAKLSAGLMRLLGRRIAPSLERVERVIKPRWPWLIRRERVIGVALLYLSLILALPLPFVNMPPGICVVLLSLALVQRDGVMAALGLAGTAALTTTLFFVIDGVIDLLVAIWT